MFWELSFLLRCSRKEKGCFVLQFSLPCVSLETWSIPIWCICNLLGEHPTLPSLLSQPPGNCSSADSQNISRGIWETYGWDKQWTVSNKGEPVSCRPCTESRIQLPKSESMIRRGWSFVLPQKMPQRECRNAIGWREDDYCQCLRLQGSSSAGISMGQKVLQIPGDVIWIKESFCSTKLPTWYPGQVICIIVFYFISKLLIFVLKCQIGLRMDSVLFVVSFFSWSVIWLQARVSVHNPQQSLRWDSFAYFFPYSAVCSSPLLQ